MVRVPSQTRVAISPHRSESRAWTQTVRAGTKDDRMLSEVTVSLPPRLAGIDCAVPSTLGSRADDALRLVVRLDETHGRHLAALSALLLRAESVASSKIEGVSASMDDYARALHGIRANASATSMVASTHALHALIGSVDGAKPLAWTGVLAAHRILMQDDPQEAAYAGRVRDMQNWIGGSDHSPRGALHVPPPPDTVGGYVEDLVEFVNRDDLGVMVQAAVSHAQFESIHPFTDGNGRIGRALVNTVLRRRGVTSRVVLPLASALVARRDDYFDDLDSYRAGDAGPILAAFSGSAVIAAEESMRTAGRLAQLPIAWMDAAGSPRAGSAPRRILDSLLDAPILSAEEVASRIGGATSSVYAGIERLVGAGVLRPLTNRRRRQVWGAAAILDELDDLGVRIGDRARRELR